MSMSKTPKLDEFVDANRGNHFFAAITLTAIKARDDIAALEVRYQENWNKNEKVIEKRHAEEIRQAKREAYEEAAMMVQASTSNGKLEPGSAIAYAYRVLREKAGKL